MNPFYKLKLALSRKENILETWSDPEQESRQIIQVLEPGDRRMERRGVGLREKEGTLGVPLYAGFCFSLSWQCWLLQI